MILSPFRVREYVVMTPFGFVGGFQVISTLKLSIGVMVRSTGAEGFPLHPKGLLADKAVVKGLQMSH
jgi:hypothetical protein